MMLGDPDGNWAATSTERSQIEQGFSRMPYALSYYAAALGPQRLSVARLIRAGCEAALEKHGVTSLKSLVMVTFVVR